MFKIQMLMLLIDSLRNQGFGPRRIAKLILPELTHLSQNEIPELITELREKYGEKFVERFSDEVWKQRKTIQALKKAQNNIIEAIRSSF